MSEPLKNPLKHWPYVLGAALLIGLIALFAWDREQQRKLTETLAQAARPPARAPRTDRLEAMRAWERLDKAATGLAEDDDPQRRKEALAHFRQELHRLKARYAYPQLGSSQPGDFGP
jgi:hypothetical protein